VKYLEPFDDPVADLVDEREAHEHGAEQGELDEQAGDEDVPRALAWRVRDRPHSVP